MPGKKLTFLSGISGNVASLLGTLPVDDDAEGLYIINVFF